jgi:hypothetical protein
MTPQDFPTIGLPATTHKLDGGVMPALAEPRASRARSAAAA